MIWPFAPSFFRKLWVGSEVCSTGLLASCTRILGSWSLLWSQAVRERSTFPQPAAKGTYHPSSVKPTWAHVCPSAHPVPSQPCDELTCLSSMPFLSPPRLCSSSDCIRIYLTATRLLGCQAEEAQEHTMYTHSLTLVPPSHPLSSHAAWQSRLGNWRGRCHRTPAPDAREFRMENTRPGLSPASQQEAQGVPPRAFSPVF